MNCQILDKEVLTVKMKIHIYIYFNLVVFCFPTIYVNADTKVFKRIDIGTNYKFRLGGLFPVHNKGYNETMSCGDILIGKGIQRLEAMLYAIDQINNNQTYWNFTLGATILDTCSFDSYALDQSLQFLQSSCDSIKRRVTGVVGAANSAVSESVANIFRLFKIPQVSYASTSEELDNLHKYPFFFRVVPSDRFQVRVILDILFAFQWTFISAVASKGDYGESAIQSLQGLIRNTTFEEICFATVQILPRHPTSEDYDSVIHHLEEYEKARVVVVFLNEDKTKDLLTAVRRNRVPSERFVWLGSDGWGAKTYPVEGNEMQAAGAITILPKRFPVKAGFDEYFKSLNPRTNTRNIWFKEYWEAQFDCRFNDSGELGERKKLCTGDEDIGNSFRQEGLVPMVIDSVYVLANAIRSLCKEYPEFCTGKGDKYRNLLKEYIINTTFKSSQGHDMIISFDSTRSIPVNYTIYQFKKAYKIGDIYEYKAIGEWNPYTKLRIRSAPVWNWKDYVDELGKPISSCSEQCELGEERIRNLHLHRRCCWTCRPCEAEYFLPDPYGHCTECPQGQIPNKDKTSCIDLKPEYIGRNLNSPWALVPFVFSLFGILCTSGVFAIFLIYHKTPIIMASGRELCYVILIGIMFCYCFTFVVLSQPTEISCGMLRIGMGLGLAVCYSAIFTKTNRISRIFNRNLRITRRPSYISPESQIVICLCLILIQVTLTVLWLIVKPPSMRQMLLENPRAWVVVCNYDGISVILGLSYNMVLIILCTVYAYKTRNIPENFNESKYISFTMYSSCIVWLAFVPIYCSTWQDYKVQSTILCMSVSISGTVTLACLFLPKIYIVIFRPEKNIRYPSSANNTGTGNYTTTQPVRFLRPIPNTE